MALGPLSALASFSLKKLNVVFSAGYHESHTWVIIFLLHFPFDQLDSLVDEAHLSLENSFQIPISNTFSIDDDVIWSGFILLAIGLHPLFKNSFDRIESLLVRWHQFSFGEELGLVIV